MQIFHYIYILHIKLPAPQRKNFFTCIPLPGDSFHMNAIIVIGQPHDCQGNALNHGWHIEFFVLTYELRILHI